MAKQSRLSRLAKLGGLTTKVTSGWVGQRLRSAFADEDERDRLRERFHLDSAEQVVETLSRLKGAAMKVGQSLSVAAGHLDLPDDVRAMLDTLQSEAEPVPFAAIRATVEAELELPLAEAFSSFDEAPLGTASLAQAHAATLPDGRPVVVKVLHDGVDEAVDADLLALRALLASGRAFGRDRGELDAIYDEVRSRLLEELDYLQEAANQYAFAQAFHDDPRVRIPRHHPPYCTERVLVMDRLTGVPLRRFLEEAAPEVRQRAGMNLAHLFLSMTFRHRLLHADPHPGNYLFEEDGRVDLLDFGCVKRFDPWWIANYARAVKGALLRDRELLLTAVRDLGAWQGDSPGAADAIVDFCETIVSPWRDQPYTVGGHDDTVLERLQPVSRALWGYPEIHGPPDIVFLHRTLGGLYSIAREFRTTARWDEVVLPYLDEAIANAEA